MAESGIQESVLKELGSHISNAIEILNQYKAINEEKLKRSKQQNSVSDEDLIELKKVFNLFVSEAEEATKLFYHVRDIIHGSHKNKIDGHIKDLVAQVAEVAASLGKEKA